MNDRRRSVGRARAGWEIGRISGGDEGLAHLASSGSSIDGGQKRQIASSAAAGRHARLPRARNATNGARATMIGYAGKCVQSAQWPTRRANAAPAERPGSTSVLPGTPYRSPERGFRANRGNRRRGPRRGMLDARRPLRTSLGPSMKPIFKISLVALVAVLAGNRIADYLYDTRRKLRR
jgi:hypothetical protein